MSTIHKRKVSIPLVEENVALFSCKQQQYNQVQGEIVNKQADLWHDTQATRFSNSQWCHRTSVVKKEDGSDRVVVDYKNLNSVTKKDSGGLGTLGTMHHRLRNRKFFTPIDLPQAYHQLTIKESDRHKTTFRDARGRLHEFNRCGFCLTTIPAVFSASLRDTLRPAEADHVESWPDDILLHNETLDEHLALIAWSLELLHTDRYSVHFLKSVFCVPEVEFLGALVGRAGIRPAPSKIKAVQELELPRTVGETRAFLGLAGFL